ncbi:hypothetical protein EC988_010178, partial [Linderina pennispora]
SDIDYTTPADPDIITLRPLESDLAKLGLEQQQPISPPSSLEKSSRRPPGADDSSFLISGPLLPIRQARRGVPNSNRNYRIIGTHTFMASAELQSQQADIVTSMLDSRLRGLYANEMADPEVQQQQG